MKQNAYEIVTQTILDKLEKGIVPWKHYTREAGVLGLPTNAVTGKRYSGVNVWTLACQQTQSSVWASYKQWSEKGRQVRKG